MLFVVDTAQQRREAEAGDTERQTALTRDASQRQVAQLGRDGRTPVCPDCGQDVAASKSGGKPLPDHEVTCFGWQCEDCDLTLPSNCGGPEAPGFVDRMVGLRVEFRDGVERWVPVPRRQVED